MADFDMYGPAQNGAALAIKDQQAAQINNLAMQESVQNMQYKKGQILEQQQKLHQQQVAEQQHAQALNMIQQNKTANTFEMGEQLLRAGHTEEGTAMLKAASESVEKMSIAAKNNIEEQIKRAEYTNGIANRFAQSLENIHSQADYDSAVQDFNHNAMGGKLPPEVINAKWSPVLKEKLLERGTAWKDQTKAQLDMIKEQREAQDSASKRALDRARTLELEEKTRIEGLKRERLAKNGGENVKTVRTPKEDVATAMNLIKQKYPDVTVDSTSANNEATYIASQAQVLLQKNKGMDRTSAIQQAFNNAVASGDVTTKTEKHWLGDKTKTDFKHGDSSSFASEGEAAAAEKAGKLKKGDRITINGVSGRWE